MPSQRSPLDIQKEILDKLNIGMDVTAGSFISCLTGAIATQIASLEANVYTIKTQSNSLFCDSESLIMLGRRIGVFVTDATPAEFEINVTTPDFKGLKVDDILAIDGISWNYKVIERVSERTYYIQCTQKGTEPNAVNPAWYEKVIFRRIGDDSIQFDARITQTLREGHEKEDIDHYRQRVANGYYTRPFAANGAWFREHLIQLGYGIGSVRVTVSRCLTGSNIAVVTVYVNGNTFEPISTYVSNQCKAELEETMPVGMQYMLDSAIRLASNILIYKIYIASADSYAISLYKSQIVTEFREVIRNTVDKTYPTERIALSINELTLRLQDIFKTAGHKPTLEIVYNETTYNTGECMFEMSHIPWITDEQIEFFDSTTLQKIDIINLIPDP